MDNVRYYHKIIKFCIIRHGITNKSITNNQITVDIAMNHRTFHQDPKKGNNTKLKNIMLT